MATVTIGATADVDFDVAGNITGVQVHLGGTASAHILLSERSDFGASVETNFRVQGILDQGRPPVTPPAGASSEKQRAFVMPTPTLDQYGRPT